MRHLLLRPVCTRPASALAALLTLLGTLGAHCAYGQNVNEFTGAFNYNCPLLNVPSNRGNGVSIDAAYGAGIQMEQAASEIGLGWNINAGGAIYRSVSGLPDDTKSYNWVTLPTGETISNGQGALYPDPTGSVYDYDLAHLNRGLDTAEFVCPDYDHYSVTGPGYTGELKLTYFKFYGYKTVSMGSGLPNKLTPDQGLVPGGTAYYRRPQFYFAGDFADTIVSRHYPAALTGTTAFQIPTDGPSAPGFSTSTEPFIGLHLNGSTVSNQNFDIPTGRLATSNFVEYFRNGEIDTAAGVGFSGTNGLDDFMDYKSSHGRSPAAFPSEGIGCFRITASNGLTYHYSLPVYETANTQYYLPLQNDYSLLSALSTTDIPDASGYDLVAYGSNQLYLKSKTYNKTAIKWLLTAITGPDFVDVNSNHQVDDGDAGYWVSYDYQLWSSGFIQRSPWYGYDYNYSPDGATQHYPSYLPIVPASPGEPYKLSGLNGSAALNKTEVYHLAKIRTSSHTAVFIRDIRNDEKGADSLVDASSNFTPDLLLKRILLFRNEQLDSIVSAHPTTTFTPGNYAAFNFAAINNSGAFFTEAWYQAQYNNFYFCILKHIYFDQDYSLCRGYHGNVNVNWSGCTVLKAPTDVETNLSNASYANSGKLSLNRMVTYDFQNGKVTPSILFDYGASSAITNPDYSPRKTDYWGYYKSDATQKGYSRYTSVLSAGLAQAWSLQKITDPLGGITQMVYEPNTYSKVIDNEAPGGVRGAAFIYRIQQATSISPNFMLTMEEGGNSQSSLAEFLSFNPTAIPGMKSKICIPYMQAVCNSGAYCINPYDPSNIGGIYSGFVFGDCTFTVNPGMGTTNNVTGSVTPTGGIRAAENYYMTRRYTGNLSNAYFNTVTAYSDTVLTSDITYSGNGFLMCELPIGYSVYGNGIRVKQLKSKNSFSGSNETYVTDYTYENGVATNEADRFNYQVLKTGCAGSPARYDFLQPKNLAKFELGPGVGYGKVTVKDLGRINNANGKTEITYITDPADEGGAFGQNYAIQTLMSTSTSTGGLAPSLGFYFINECNNRFSNIFGRTKMTKVYDKNNNVIAKTVYEYVSSAQGASVENFYFENLIYGLDYPTLYSGGAAAYTVNILRDYPVVTKSTTSYGIGSLTKTESLVRDELTGETTAMRSSGANQSSSISFKTPAYKFYQATAALSFTTAAFRKLLPLGNDFYTYSNVDSVFTSSSFLRASYRLYSPKVRQRQYNSGSGLFSINTATLPYYANNRVFVFDAGPGSNDAYGLLNKSNLYSNPLSIGSLTATLFWEPGSTYNWKLAYENTLLDHYKNLVEVRDANNRFSASKFGYQGYYKNAAVSNCNYASFTFADFENPPGTFTTSVATIDGDVMVKSSNTFMKNTDVVNGSPLVPHSGSKCILVSSDPLTYTTVSEQSPGGTLEIGLQSGRIYRASVWTHTTNLANAQLEITVTGTVNVASPYTVNTVYTASSANNLVTTIGNWNLLQIDFELPEKFTTGSGGQFTIQLKSANSGTVYFDDFILHPVESDFSASVYNPRNGRVTSMLDGNGLATHFVYDAAGRTLEVWKEIPSVGYKKIKVHTYNYARGAAN